jgi:outer membrane protein OmpA-like peptidoglycan-associated protein
MTIALILMVLMQCGGQKTIVKGLVEVGSIYGFVLDEGYLPIAKAQVLVAGDNEFITFTNDAGYFIFDDLIPGKYNIVITRYGYEPENLDVKVSKDELNELNIVLRKSEKQGGLVSGVVVDFVTKKPLVVDVMVTDLGLTTTTDSSGHFSFENLNRATYLLKFMAMDYITSHTDVTVLPDETAEIVVHLIKGGTVITLEGIEFEFGKAIIKKQSTSTLDWAAAILTNHPEIEVEIQGHTDSIGTAEANLKLSQARAGAVRDYLIDIHMIEPVRLIPIGYGMKKPIADNATEAGRAKNRRVDFVVMKD